MNANKILYITQEITPYVPETDLAIRGRKVPQLIQEGGREIRIFMPKWGNVNERRNQLHEVIRLSGMNIIIDETDHPLLIKVASIQAARMQVYFIDNDDYFQRRQMLTDAEGTCYKDNEERAAFYARGVLETVKKLRWCPDVIHAQGLIGSLVPLFIQRSYKEDPSFRTSKVVYSLTNEQLNEPITGNLINKVLMRNITGDDVINAIGEGPYTLKDLHKLAIFYSNGIVVCPEEADKELIEFATQAGKPILEYTGMDTYIDKLSEFYESI